MPPLMRRANHRAAALVAWDTFPHHGQVLVRSMSGAPFQDGEIAAGKPYRIGSSVRSDGAEKTVWQLTARVRPCDFAQPRWPDPGRPRGRGGYLVNPSSLFAAMAYWLV